jgi:hypothetical protein
VNGLGDTSRSDKQLKRTAALLASRPGVVDHVRQTGQLPANIPSGGMHIGARLLMNVRGWDIELREDEQLVYDALVRDQKQRRQTRTLKDREQFRRLDLIYGNAPCGRLVFMERSKALENIAFWKAKTWGDFRKGAPTLYERALSHLDNEEDAPLDSSELDHELAADGDFLHFPEQLMLDFIPKLVQERYGRVEETMLNGPMLTLDPDHESKIVALLRTRGFSVQRNNALMEALYA